MTTVIRVCWKESSISVLTCDICLVVYQCTWKLRKSMIRKVKVQADRFDIDMNKKFGQPISYAERVEIEKSIGEINRAKKVAVAKHLLEQTIQRAENKAKKQAAKGKKKIFHKYVLWFYCI